MATFFLFTFRSVQKEKSCQQTNYTVPTGFHTPETLGIQQYSKSTWTKFPDNTMEVVQTGRPNLI